MIAACPRCGARYRIERHRIRPGGVRLRCAHCEAVFRVRPPPPAAATEAAPVPSPPRAVPRPSTPPPGRDRARLVVVADADPERAKQTATALMEAGLEIVLAHDGVEAILAVQRVLPRAVVLDAALPKMFGFQVCELMKRNESLRSVLVLLVGSTHHPDRYRRAPSDLYGADSYLEDTDLPGGVLRALAGLGVEFDPSRPATRAAGDSSPRPGGGAETSAPTGRLDADARAGPAPPPPTPALRSTPTPRPVSEPEPEAARPIPAATTSEAARGVAEAERLARIIVSDIVLYNEEKFVRAVREGNVLEVLGPELEEGRALFRGRIEASVRELGDFLEQELLRVARARGRE